MDTLGGQLMVAYQLIIPILNLPMIKKVFVVHNGIISNYKEIKASLIDSGIKFVSDTDTECISNLFSFCLYKKKKMSEYDALKYLYDNLKGQMSALIYDNKKLFL